MIVPEQVRKCVVFIGYQLADGQPRLVGSAFFIGRDTDTDQAKDVFLVTARHVIEGIQKRGVQHVFIRANTIAGMSVWAKCESNEWLYHKTDQTADVALLRTGVPQGWDHLVIPVSMCATAAAMTASEVALGDEVFVVGLFRHHHGTQKNIPIVRVGNLAARAEEKVVTNLGPMDAYLIEARSIGGLSGSPVFLNLGVVRYIGDGVKHATSGPIQLLLGLVHGHFDVRSSLTDDVHADTAQPLSAQRVNTGIAIVVPIEKIVETIDFHAPSDGSQVLSSN
jgi:hypothetical protein